MTPESAAVAAKPQMRMVTISLAVWVMASRRLFLVQGGRRRDEAHVRERLGEIADGLLRGPFDLLREETHVVGVSAQPVESPLRTLVLAGVGEVLHRPEAARRERILAAVHAVIRGLRAIALDELVAHQRRADVFEGALHARLARLRVAEAGKQEQARI